LGISGIRVATLGHESGNDSVKEEAVIKAAFHQFDKVIPVQWGGVIEFYDHVPEFRDDFHPAWFGVPGFLSESRCIPCQESEQQ
jgi:hypothetical protein